MALPRFTPRTLHTRFCLYHLLFFKEPFPGNKRLQETTVFAFSLSHHAVHVQIAVQDDLVVLLLSQNSVLCWCVFEIGTQVSTDVSNLLTSCFSIFLPENTLKLWIW